MLTSRNGFIGGPNPGTMVRPETDRAVAKFLAYFDQIKRLYQEAAGRPLEMYKNTEPKCLANVFESIWALPLTGMEFVAETVHRLSWSQCLGNGNHRTTTLFVADFLDSFGLAFPPDTGSPHAEARFERSLNQWIGRSQALIRRRGEPGYAQARLEPRHREITGEWVEEILRSQSEALAMTGPQRLMNFIS